MYSAQVGGHPGVTTTEDGSLLIKPALHHELEFYHALQHNPALASLRDFTPKFLGTLNLEGKIDQDQEIHPVDSIQKDISFLLLISSVISSSHAQSLVLENLSFPFLQPNILDIKLGTVLYEPLAPPEKVARMLQAAKDTTSLETGIRLTGFQVHDNHTKQPIHYPKTYGKSLKAHQLSEGITNFFPHTPPNLGLPLTTLLPILQAIHAEISEIRSLLSSLHLRMVGSSLLIVYEADWDRAHEGVKKFLLDDSDSEQNSESEGESDDDDNEGNESKKKTFPPYTVKLIDFAHTTLVPDQGPDEGVLLGLDTVLNLLKGRIDELTNTENAQDQLDTNSYLT